MRKRIGIIIVLSWVFGASAVHGVYAADNLDQLYLQKGTPYRPEQDQSTYETPPHGFFPIYAGLVARHGSRGLTNCGADLVVYNMWQKAKKEGALTAIGRALGPDVEKTMKANALLGYGVVGISGSPGYGNETKLGRAEHTQIAHRMWLRLKGLFEAQNSGADFFKRKIILVSSGITRAVDSGGYFAAGLEADQPNLKPMITFAPAPSGYPAGAPRVQPVGVNRFLLLFVGLDRDNDLVTDPADPMYRTYQASQAYQQYLKSDQDLSAKLRSLAARPSSQFAARAVLERLFTTSFVDKIALGTYTFASTGTMSFKSDDGKYQATTTGDGSHRIQNLVDAALELYELYSMAPAIRIEAGVDFSAYMPREQAKYFEYYRDAGDFYRNGPGIAEKQDITYGVAQILLDDFFQETDALATGDRSHLAKLRFAHDSIMMPLASILHLKNVTAQVPLTEDYTYETNLWRGKQIAGMAANLQWEVYSDGKNALLVRMLYNEKETDFQAACDNAKYAVQSHFYDYARLKTCYRHGSQ